MEHHATKSRNVYESKAGCHVEFDENNNLISLFKAGQKDCALKTVMEMHKNKSLCPALF